MGLSAPLGMGMCRDVGAIKGEKEGVVRGRDTAEKGTGVLWLIQFERTGGQQRHQGSRTPAASRCSVPEVSRLSLWITEVVLYLLSEYFFLLLFFFFICT